MARFRCLAKLTVDAEMTGTKLAAAIRDCVVLRAEHLIATNQFEYVIVHPDLPMLKPGQQIPEVQVKFHVEHGDPVRTRFIDVNTGAWYPSGEENH